jgi:hypothetical protein
LERPHFCNRDSPTIRIAADLVGVSAGGEIDPLEIDFARNDPAQSPVSLREYQVFAK